MTLGAWRSACPTTVEVAREIGYDLSGLNRGESLAHAAR
jgi:hypothetical protein